MTLLLNQKLDNLHQLIELFDHSSLGNIWNDTLHGERRVLLIETLASIFSLSVKTCSDIFVSLNLTALEYSVQIRTICPPTTTHFPFFESLPKEVVKYVMMEGIQPIGKGEWYSKEDRCFHAHLGTAIQLPLNKKRLKKAWKNLSEIEVGIDEAQLFIGLSLVLETLITDLESLETLLDLMLEDSEEKYWTLKHFSSHENARQPLIEYFLKSCYTPVEQLWVYVGMVHDKYILREENEEFARELALVINKKRLAMSRLPKMLKKTLN